MEELITRLESSEMAANYVSLSFLIIYSVRTIKDGERIIEAEECGCDTNLR